jgi:hypothetical protein
MSESQCVGYLMGTESRGKHRHFLSHFIGTPATTASPWTAAACCRFGIRSLLRSRQPQPRRAPGIFFLIPRASPPRQHPLGLRAACCRFGIRSLLRSRQPQPRRAPGIFFLIPRASPPRQQAVLAKAAAGCTQSKSKSKPAQAVACLKGKY